MVVAALTATALASPAGLQRPPSRAAAAAPRCPPATALPRPRRAVAAHGTGPDMPGVGAWIDLASFVASSGSGGGHTPYDELADKIGRDVYMDVAGWHLYLKDVKLGAGSSLAQALAGKLGPTLQGGARVDEADLAALLKKVPIKLGGGKATVALADLVPAAGLRDLERACEDYARSI